MIDEKLDIYRKVLRVRTSFKTISQISWNLSQLERNFSLNGASEKMLQQLLSAYMEHYLMLCNSLTNLKRDIENK